MPRFKTPRNVLRQNYGKERIDERCRQSVLEDIAANDSIKFMPISYIKQFTHVATDILVEGAVKFDLAALTNLYIYHSEGIKKADQLLETEKNETKRWILRHLPLWL